jgi:hypothetical protein
MMMAKKDDTFDKVMKGIKSTKGDSNAKRAEMDKRKARAEDQAAFDRSRRDLRRRALKRIEGDNGVIDTGMFGS